MAMALWGVTCVQAFTFFTRRSKKDSLLLKIGIALLWLLDTLQSGLDCHIVYHFLVTNYLNPIVISQTLWSIIVHVTTTSISDFLIRTMFAHRIYRLSRKNVPITTWIMLLSTIYLALGFVITAKAFKLTSFLELDKIQNWLYASFATGTASDMSVTLALIWLLMKSRTGFRRTDALINTLMKYTVNTGVIVNIDSFIVMITYVVMPKNYIFVGFYLLQNKLYLNSYLATLNARDDLREMINEPMSLHLSNMSVLRGRSDCTTTIQDSHLEKGGGSQVMAISVNTYTETDMDGSYTPPAKFTTNEVLAPGLTDSLDSTRGAPVSHGSAQTSMVAGHL